MPQPGDRYAQAFTVEPGQCWAMVHDRQGQATHCAETPSLVRAARAMRSHQELAAEVAALESDDDDRLEMLATADLMESLRPPG